jgi:tripartite-type tricarboxylate transporter receptor subunit TctC
LNASGLIAGKDQALACSLLLIFRAGSRGCDLADSLIMGDCRMLALASCNWGEVRAARRAARILRRFGLGSAALVASALCGAPQPGQAADFYAGKQITFVVSADAGQSYDTFTRLIGQYLTKYLPGGPSVIVQNMPGAGGLRATNWLYNVAPKDGLTIGMINNTLAFDPLFGDKLAQFDAAKFNWLGSPSKESGTFVIWHELPIDNIDEARNRHLILSATGTGSTPAFYARVLAAIFDLNISLIPGYTSQGEAFLAMERGENDGNASPFWSSLTAEYPSWLQEKKIKILLYYGADRDPEIPGPYVFDLIHDPAKKSLMEVAQAGLSMGRPVLAPPGVDQDKVAALRAAIDKVFKDPSYQAACAAARLNCSSPSSGAQLLDLVKSTYGAPKAAVDQISAIFTEGQGN